MSEAISILGVNFENVIELFDLLFKVSENAVNRVKHLTLAKDKELLKVHGPERPRSKPNTKEDKLLNRNDSSHELKLGSAHQRSHQRAHSANPVLMSPEKKKALSAKEGIAKLLKEQFQVGNTN